MGGQVELPALDVNVVSGINCIKISEDIAVETHQNNIFGVNNLVKKYLEEMWNQVSHSFLTRLLEFVNFHNNWFGLNLVYLMVKHWKNMISRVLECLKFQTLFKTCW